MTGEPIRKALVQVYAGQRRMTFSDDDGRFQLEGIAAGSYSLSAQKPGYLNEQEATGGGPTIVEIGPKAPPAVVRLTPESTLSGKVASSAGIPLEHVTLLLRSSEIREGRRQWEFKGTAMTDVDGRFRIANLRPGGYYLFVSPSAPQAEPLIDAPVKPTTGYSGVYYPGAPDLASATVIDLRAGEHGEANFTLNAVPVYSVSGTVSGYGNNQGVGFQVFDVSGSPVDCNVQFSALNGRFDLNGLASGNYVIRTYSSVGDNQQVRAEQRIHLTSDLHNLHLVMGPIPAISVVVQMERVGQRQAGIAALNRISTSGPPVSVRLIGGNLTGGDVYAGFENASSPQTLLLRGVDPGRYTAVIEARESWYVASAEYGDTNLLTDDLVVAPGTQPMAINLVLRNDSASVTGTVSVPEGFNSQVRIVAVPLRSAKASPAVTYWYSPRDKQIQPSEFVFDSLSPGDYRIYAFDRADAIEYANRDVLDGYLPQATQITLAPNQRAKATVQLIRTGGTSR